MPIGVYKRTKQVWNKGLKFPKESHSMFGKKHSLETRKKMSLAAVGRPSHHKGKHYKPLSDERKRKISQSQKGKIHSAEAIKKMRASAIGRKITEETRKKLRESHIGIQSGDKHPNWRGGLSFQSYPVQWTNTLKISIRERDHYRCSECGDPQGDKAHHVHHIDYDKKNCNPDNLITLCIKCHIKTNANRDFWKKYFKNKNICREI